MYSRFASCNVKIVLGQCESRCHYRDNVFGSRDSPVSRMTRLRAGRPWFDSRQGQGFFLRHRVQICSGVNPASSTIDPGVFYLVVKRPGREATHLHVVPHFPIYLHGTFYLVPRFASLQDLSKCNFCKSRLQKVCFI
jgi:hypothetical protein